MAEADRKIDSVKGTRDVLPDEFELRRRTWEKIVACFERFGYRGVEVPTIEKVDLHLRKSGEAIRQHMYTFRDHGQVHLCLRPELTASVARMYTSTLAGQPLPQKLYYLGSSFRYDQPQRGRYREFTQAGVELVGGRGPESDAEVIALACHVMDALGITEYEVVIGNIGIILELLSQKKIEERVKSRIVESMEALSREDTVQQAMKRIKDGLKEIGVSLEEPNKEQMELRKAVSQLPEEQTTKVVSWVLETIYGSTDTRRSPDQIARNLLARIRTDEQVKQITETIEFISQLTQIRGRPPEVFECVDTLIQDYNLDARPIDDLRTIARYLDRYGIDWEKVRIDFGFGRGLQYYTGMIFEIYVNDEEKLAPSQRQVCGGGRYDTLIGDLADGQNVLALGFSFGFERLVLSLPTEEHGERRLDAFVAPIGENEEFEYALEVANALRAEGVRTDIGLKGMAPRDLTGMAKRLQARHAVFVGKNEMSDRCVSLKDMKTGKQITCSIAQAVSEIKSGGE